MRTELACGALVALLSFQAQAASTGKRTECALCEDRDLPAILVELAHADPSRRLRAVEQLARLDDALALQPLARVALSDPTPAVRRAGMTALAGRRDLHALDTLLDGTEDRYLSVRIAALEALGTYAVARSRIRVELALRDRDRPVPERLAALEALKKHRTLEAHDAIVVLAAELAETPKVDDALRAAITEGARSAKPCTTCVEARSTPVMVELFDLDPARRAEAAASIGELSVPPTEKVRLIARVTRDEAQTVRHAAAHELVDLAKQTPEAIPLMAETYATSADDEIRRELAKALLDDQSPRVDEALTETVRDARSPVAKRALALLSIRDTKASSRGLAEAVAHPDAKVARRALERLANRHLDKETRHQAIEHALRHRDKGVVSGGIVWLSANEVDEHTEALIVAAETPGLSTGVGHRLVKALGASKDPKTIAPLIKAAESAPTQLRDEAMGQLAKRTEPAAREALRKLAVSGDSDVAKSAMRAGSSWADTLSPEELIAILDKEDPEATRAVLAAVERRKAKELEALVPVIVVTLHQSDLTTVATGLRLLVRTPNPGRARIIAILEEAIGTAPTPEVATYLYRYLLKWKPNELDALQRRLLADTQLPSEIRINAAGAIAQREPPDLRTFLEPFREDADDEVQRTVRLLFARAREPTTVAGVKAKAADVIGELDASAGEPTVEPGDALVAAEPAGPAGPAAEPGELAAEPGGETTEPEDLLAHLPTEPELEAELPELEAPDLPWNGRWPLVLSMAGLGTLAFGTVADVAEVGVGGTAVASAVGAVVGGATPFLLTLDRDVTAGQAFYITSHTAWAAAAGWQGAYALGMNDLEALPGLDRGVGILAGLAGVGLATWRAPNADWSGRDALYTNVTALQAGVATYGIARLVTSGQRDVNDARLRALGVASAWGLGLLPATLTVDNVELTKNDAALMALTMGTGTWMGAWLGMSGGNQGLSSNGEKLAVGALAGQAVGYLGGLVLSSQLEVEPRTSLRLAMVGGVGAAAGLGVAAAWRPTETDYGQLGLVLDGGMALAIATTLALPQVREFAPNKRGMLVLSALYGGGLGSSLVLLDPELNDAGKEGQRYFGGLLLGASVGTLVGSAIAPVVDPTPKTLAVGAGTVGVLAAGGAGLGLISCWSSDDCPSRQRMTLFTQAGAVAGVITAGVAADKMPASGAAVSTGLAASSWGAWNGYLLTRLGGSSDAARAGGAVTLGSLAGSVGYLVADRAELGGFEGWLGLAGSIVGNAWGAGLGYLIPRSSEQLRLTSTVSAPLGLAAIGGAMALVWSGQEKPSIRGVARGYGPVAEVPAALAFKEVGPLRVTLGALAGGWHTALLPYHWDPTAPQKDWRVTGGAVVGSLTGAALSVALAPVLTDADVSEAVAYSAVGNLIGTGIAAYRDSDYALTVDLVGVGALLIGGVAAPFTTFEAGDPAWIATSVALGTAHGALLTDDLLGSDVGGSTRLGSGALLGGAAVGLATLTAAQFVGEQSEGDVVELAATTLALDTLGVGTLMLADIDPDSWVLGIGLAGSIALANVTAPATAYDTNDYIWMAGGTALGAWHGLLWDGYPGSITYTAEGGGGGAMVGGAVGLLGVGALSQFVERDPYDVGESLIAAGIGNTLALGLSDLIADPNRRKATALIRGRMSLGLGLGLGAAATVLSPRTSYDSAAWIWAGTLGLVGGWHGGMLGGRPGSVDAALSRGGALTGGSLGLLTGAVASQWYRPQPLDAAEAVVASGFGNTLGLGVGLALRPGNADLHGRLMQGIGLATFLGGSLVAPRTAYDSGDAVYGGAAMALGAWHGLLWTGYPGSSAFKSRRAAGGALIGASIGAVGGALISDLAERSAPDAAEIVLAAGLGNALGAGIGEVAASYGDTSSALTGRLAMGFGLGLGGLAVALSPRTTYDTETWLWASSLGLVGSWTGVLLGGRPGAIDDGQRSWGGALTLGSLATAGAAVGSQWYRPDLRDTGEATLAAGLGNGVGLGLGLLAWPARSDSNTHAGLMQGLGVAALAAGTWAAPRTVYVADDAPLVTGALTLAGVTGFFLPEVWTQWDDADIGDDRRRTNQRFGGTLLGVSAGALAGMGLSQGFDLSWGDTLEIGVSYAGGSALGYGLGGLIDLDNRKLQVQSQLAGALVATAGSLWWHQHTTYSLTDFGAGALGIAIGVWHGQLTTRNLTDKIDPDLPTPDSARAEFATYVASGAGLFGSMALAQMLEYSGGDLFEIGLAAVTGNVMGFGMTYMRRSRDDGTRRVLAQHVAGLGMVGAAAALTKWTHFEAADATTLVLTTTLGAGLGAWLPSTWYVNSFGKDHLGGALTGGSVGLVAGAVASQWLGVTPPRAIGIASRAMTAAALADGGSQLFLAESSAKTRAQVGVAGTVGLAVGLEIARPVLRLDEVELEMLPFGALVGGMHGVWLTPLVSGPEDTRQWISGVEMGAAAGLLAVGLTSPFDTRDAADWTEITLAAAVGNLTGLSAGCAMSDTSCSEGIGAGAALSAELVGLGATGLALAFAHDTSYSGADYAFIASSGLAFGAYGALLSSNVLSPEEDNRVVEGIGLGSGIGLLAGAAAANAWRPQPTDSIESLLASGLAGLFVAGTFELFDPGSMRVQSSIVAGTGLAVYGAAAYFSPKTEYTGSDWALIGLATAIGGVGGSRLGVFVEDEDGPSPATGALLGGILGVFTGALTSQQLQLDTSTMLFASGGAVAGGALGWAGGQLAGPGALERDKASAVGITLGAIGLGIGGGMFGEKLSIGAANAGMISLIGVMGAWHGTWLSRAWTAQPYGEDHEMQLVGGGLLGAGAGLITGAAFAHNLEYSGADIAESAMGWAAAGSFGAGLGLLVSDDDRVAYALMEGIGAGGTFLMASVAPQTDFDLEDWALGVLATGQGVWQGIGTAQLFNEDDPRKIAGGIMVTTAAGGVAGALLSQRLDLSMAETLSGFSGTLWGAWVGAWLGVAYGEEMDLKVAGLSAAGSDVGLLLSSLAVSRIGDMPPARVGFINVFGVGGALAGAAIGLFIQPLGETQEARAVKGTLYGTTVALAAGAVLTGVFELGTTVVVEEETPEAEIESAWRVPEWLPDVEVAIPMVGPVPPRNPEEPVTDPGIFVGVQGLF